MKLLVLSDIHGVKFKLKPLISLTNPDYIVIPGDLPTSIDIPTLVLTYGLNGSRTDYVKNIYTRYLYRITERQIKSAKRLILELIEFDIPIILIHGNTETKETRFWLDLFSHRYPLINWISDGHIKFDGTLFVGHGWVPIIKNHNRASTPGEVDEEIARTILLDTIGRAKQKSDNTLLISHAPPMNTKIDYLPHRKYHAGSNPVKEMLDSGYFNGVISGHLHESWGFHQSDKNWWGINAGSVAEDLCCLVDTLENKITWHRNLVIKGRLNSFLYRRRRQFNYDRI